MPNAQTATLTAVAMIAFAANSLLCRMALGAGLIDAGSFASLRTVAGALMLAVLLAWRGNLQSAFGANHWRTGAMLFTYMVFFTFAYRSLSAASTFSIRPVCSGRIALSSLSRQKRIGPYLT